MQESHRCIAAIADVVQAYTEAKLNGDQAMGQIHDLILELFLKELPEGVTVVDLSNPHELHTKLAQALGENGTP